MQTLPTNHFVETNEMVGRHQSRTPTFASSDKPATFRARRARVSKRVANEKQVELRFDDKEIWERALGESRQWAEGAGEKAVHRQPRIVIAQEGDGTASQTHWASGSNRAVRTPAAGRIAGCGDLSRW